MLFLSVVRTCILSSSGTALLAANVPSQKIKAGTIIRSWSMISVSLWHECCFSLAKSPPDGGMSSVERARPRTARRFVRRNNRSACTCRLRSDFSMRRITQRNARGRSTHQTLVCLSQPIQPPSPSRILPFCTSCLKNVAATTSAITRKLITQSESTGRVQGIWS